MARKQSSNEDYGTELVVEKAVKEPSRYRVLLHNDNYTTMDFVVNILCFVFHKSAEEATAIMLKVHREGIGECGIYTQEIAESKMHMVLALARKAQFPLQCTIEEV